MLIPRSIQPSLYILLIVSAKSILASPHAEPSFPGSEDWRSISKRFDSDTVVPNVEGPLPTAGKSEKDVEPPSSPEPDAWKRRKSTRALDSPPFANSTTQSGSGKGVFTHPSTGTRPSKNITSEAYACHSSSVAYEEARAAQSYSTSYEKSSWSIPVGHADVYTTVEGIPVAHGTLTSTGVRWTTTENAHSTVINDTISIPDCWIDQEVCIEMYRDYMKDMGRVLYVDELPPVSPAPTNSPRCGRPLFPLNSKGDGTSIIGRE